MTLAQRLEALEPSGFSIARVSRLAGVAARKLYYGDGLSPEERARVETVLARIEAGDIAPRMRGLKVTA